MTRCADGTHHKRLSVPQQSDVVPAGDFVEISQIYVFAAGVPNKPSAELIYSTYTSEMDFICRQGKTLVLSLGGLSQTYFANSSSHTKISCLFLIHYLLFEFPLELCKYFIRSICPCRQHVFFPSWEVYHCARLVPSCKNSCRLTCLQGSTAAGRSRHLS